MGRGAIHSSIFIASLHYSLNTKCGSPSVLVNQLSSQHLLADHHTLGSSTGSKPAVNNLPEGVGPTQADQKGTDIHHG
jgi:hypothetical protein